MQIAIVLIFILVIGYYAYAVEGIDVAKENVPISTQENSQQLKIGERNIQLDVQKNYYFPNGEELVLRSGSSTPEFYPNRTEMPKVFTPLHKTYRYHSEEYVYELVNNGCAIKTSEGDSSTASVKCDIDVIINRS